MVNFIRSFALLATLASATTGLSTFQPQARGCAATPLDKKQIAVFGAGGMLGASVFGFVQRASNIYGTGMGGASSPRSICATAMASDYLNRKLSAAFKLAYAGENMVRLTNMQDVDAIAARLSGMNAAVIGTVYQLETLPVTGNTYEKGPNDKTYEFYLDKRTMARTDVLPEDEDTHLALFQKTITACKASGVEHVVVVETPQTVNPKPFAEILDKGGVPFTYIHASGKYESCKSYTFEMGVQDDLKIESFTLSENYISAGEYNPGDWMESLADSRSVSSEDDTVFREDIAALAVQSLLSLNWKKSRCLEVSSIGKLSDGSGDDVKRPWRNVKTDRDWCVKSNVLAQKLLAVE
uniref:Uncharacterized protein n=1 Tax=Odontella aurita TaxID=265563 RepID=A0A6U6KXL5_9STRA|mmetsp:Transcript_63006/g.186085  ORF Transcript_63006/g.186085 Transcript_63006/m.186085 type:complete len:353 (+) Transcript_63006:246-1304(+)